MIQRTHRKHNTRAYMVELGRRKFIPISIQKAILKYLWKRYPTFGWKRHGYFMSRQILQEWKQNTQAHDPWVAAACGMEGP